ncbi:MAG: tetratricopeptide repeat protein [Muribaculaceae bacterium]|nr:tetratricopeptide repeat protein [Muribaculaceae bacterium]
MNLKHLMLAMAAGFALNASAQTQGYMDGIEYFKADQFDNAREILSRTIDAPETDRATALYYLGAVALQDGDNKTAAENFTEGINLNPKNGLNYVGLGSMLLKNGDAKGAAEQFKLALKAQKKASVMVAIARAYYQADPVAYAKEYEKYMNDAYSKDKKNTDYYIMRGDKLRDEAIAEGEFSQKIGEAASEYTQAIYWNSNTPEAYVKYSKVFAKINPQYAIEKLQELLTIAPNSAMAQRELAERYYDNDQWTRAAQQYAEYIKNPNHFVQDEERYAVLLYFGEKYQESLDLAKSILAKQPNSVQMKRILFLDLDKLGQTEAAKAAADEFFAMPDVRFTANDYSSYAGILNELEEYDGEVEAWKKAVATNPDKVDLLKNLSTAYSQAGSRALKSQKAATDEISSAAFQEEAHQAYINSLNAYKQYIDAGTYSTQDLVDLGSRYQNVAATAEAGSEEKAEAINGAIAAIDQVIARVPENFIPYRNKARMLLVKNDNQPSEESAATYTKMLELLDLDPQNRTDRADTYREGFAQIASYYLSIKDVDGAKTWYLKMLELDPENQALRDYIEKLK